MRAPRSSRRGVLLLVVLSLLVLFMLIGTAFLMSSNQYRHASQASAKLDRVGNYPTKLLDRAVMQVLRDTGNRSSVVRSHSLLRDLYGSEGFEAVAYSPINSMLSATFSTTQSQVSRYATPTNGAAPNPPLGPTQGQLIDVYFRELAFKANDPLTPGNDATVLTTPDARHVLKLEPSVNGLPEMYNMPLTKGYFNGCLLTITSGPARGQSTRIVDYEYIGDLPTDPVTDGPPFPRKNVSRLFRIRVMAFSRADGGPLLARSQLDPSDRRYSNSPSRGRELCDLVATTEQGTNANSITATTGATFIVNGRPFNGTGVGFNELAAAGQPRLNAVETVGITSDETKWLYPEIALLPNAAFFIPSDPTTSTGANTDKWGARYPNPATGTYDPLNPKTIALADRPLLWKYRSFAGPGDADESYDAPDFQNMALAMQTVTPRARGRVVQGRPDNPQTLEVDSTALNSSQFLRLDLEDLPLPSFFRPDLENYWFHKLIQFAMTADGASEDDAVRAVLAPYGADGIRDAPGVSSDDPGVSVDVRDQIVAVKRKISLRPLREDHPNFDGSNPASRPPDLAGVSNLMRGGNIAIPFWEAVGPWDVDNDNDGVPDSVWVDLGDPVAQAEDGTLYKPLYAFLIVDLDSRLNVNAHGLVDDLRAPNFDPTLVNPVFGNQTYGNLANDVYRSNLPPNREIGDSNLLPHGMGYGPAEISLRPVLSPNLPGNATYAANIGNPGFGSLLNADDYARLLVGRPASVGPPQWPSVWGRFGSVELFNGTVANALDIVKPGMTFAVSAANATTDVLPWMKMFGYPRFLSEFYSANPAMRVPSAFSTPPDLMGRYALGLDYTGQPVSEPSADYASIIIAGGTDALLLGDSPYELNLSDLRRRDVPDPGTIASIAGLVSGGSAVAVDEDAPFATADLERILRAYDADAGILPDRLWNVVDAFDPLKMASNQPAAVFTQAQQQFGSNPGNAELLASAQQMAGITRRLVTTDSYDLPVSSQKMPAYVAALGADGAPGVAGTDDDPDGPGPLTATNGADDPTEIGAPGSDDFQALTGTPFEQGTIVDLLRYRVQRERIRQGLPPYDLTVAAQKAAFETLVNQLTQLIIAPEILAGGKMDLNRPFGDGRDNPDPITGVVNGIVDDPAEAGEPFLDVNGNGKYEAGEKWIDVDADGEYDRPIDRLWDGLTAEPITFDYTNGQAVPIRAEAYGAPVVPGGGVRNLNSQGRQLYARQLYCLMMLLMDENYLEMPDIPSLLGNSLNLELLLIKIAKDNGNPPFSPAVADKLQARRKLTAQRIAQWAINCVDERDADSIMTAFEYDENPWDGWGCPDGNGDNIPLDGDLATDENLGGIIDWTNVNPGSGPGSPPTKPIIPVTAPPVVANRTRGVVWGAERPELLITETLAFHDRRCTDEKSFGNPSIFDPEPTAPNEYPDYDLDQRLKPRGSLFVELYNPWTADGNKPKEFYGSVPASGVPDQGVMLNRLSDLADPVSGKFSPVWRMSILRDPLNGRMPVFRDPATKRLDSGVMDMAGFGVPQASDQEPVTSDFLTIDPDGYNTNLDDNAERHVYFTSGDNFQTPVSESDANRSNDNNVQAEYTNIPNHVAAAINPNVNVRVPPLSYRLPSGSPPVQTSRRYFIARTEREPSVVGPNDRDVTIAPILPGRYAVVGSSGLQLQGPSDPTLPPPKSTPDGQVTDRFVTPISRQDLNPVQLDPDHVGNMFRTRRIELWPNPAGRPDVHQVLVAENGGPEFVRTDSSNVVNVTDPDHNNNPTNTPADDMMIDPCVAIPVEDLSISEPVEGYPSNLYREQFAKHTGSGLVEPALQLNAQGELVYDAPYYNRPLDMEFELIRNGTTQNYRSVHLERLANPTLPWNPPPIDSYGNPNPLHRAWLPVNPYRTIDSQSVDLTAYNGATSLERTNLPTSAAVANFGGLGADLSQANIIAPITASQFLDAPDHVLWSIILLLKLKGVPSANSPEELRGAGAADVEQLLTNLEAVELSSVRQELTDTINDTKYPNQYLNGWQEGWWWHMMKRVLPDDKHSGTDGTTGAFRQWMHLKSLERGFHASNYFKYPKPGAFYAPPNPPAPNIEGWAPDVSVLPRTLWKQERPNARLFLQGASGIVDASDLKNVTSRRVLSHTPANPKLTPEEETTTIPDSEITRNQLIWNRLDASTSGFESVVDFVMEQTLGFANESYTPDLERVDDQIAATMMAAPRRGAPEVATQSIRRPADPVQFEIAPNMRDKEIWNAQRQAGRLNGPNPVTPQPSLLQMIVDATNYPTIENRLVQEFYDRRRLMTKSTYPWLAWNDRPLVSAEEILQVPASSSSLMLRDYSLPTLFTPNAFDGSRFADGIALPLKSIAQQIAGVHAPFGHLLNMFAASLEPATAITDPLEPTGGPNFYRILDYVEVPSRYVGTDTMLSPEVFNDPTGSDITSPADPRYSFQPPFNKVSRERDPGRVNLNTVTGRRRVEPSGFVRHWSEVYDGIMHRYGDSNLLDASNNVLQLSHFGPAWRDVELSRRGYAQYNADNPSSPIEKLVTTQIQPETLAFGLNRDFPSVFSNPFRSADAGDLVPRANMVRPGVDATFLRGHHWQRADDDTLITNPFAPRGSKYGPIAWGRAGEDDDGNGIIDDVREAGYGVIDTTIPPGLAMSPYDGDTLRIKPSANNALESSGIPLFSESLPEPAIDAERNPYMMYQPMTRLGNLVTTRSNVYAIWVTVGYFEVEKAPDWNDPIVANKTAIRARFGGTTTDADDKTVRARALYDRVYPEGYTLGEELGTDTGNTRRQRAFYIIDRTEPVGFKPGEDLNVERMIRVRRRIE